MQAIDLKAQKNKIKEKINKRIQNVLYILQHYKVFWLAIASKWLV